MLIGQDVDRIDALDKVLGKPVFSGDITFPGMLHGCILRSTRPHSLIRRIDIKGALFLDGVVKVITWNDIPGENRFGIMKKDQLYLAEDRVRYIGEPILLVLAEDELTARKALTRIKVEYEDIEAIHDPLSALKTTVCIHGDENLLCSRTLIKGNIEKGFTESDVIVEHTYRTTWIDHGFLETESGVGWIDESGKITISSSTQNIHYKRKEISRLLAMPEERIRVIQAATGGGFGGKLDMTVEGYISLAVYYTKRPVRIRYSREESFLSNTKRHPLHIEYKTGLRKDGSIAAVKASIIGDTGPYISYGEVVCLRVALHATGPYEVPNVHVESRMFYTNNPVSGAMRGFGVPQLAFAHESQLDEGAELLGLDPLDVRMKNALKKGSLTATSQVLEHSAGLPETLKSIEPFWRARRKAATGSGFGLACMFYGIGNTGSSNPSNCYLRLTEDGKIALHSGVCDIGQGSSTVLLQILCEALHVAPSDIVIPPCDTDISNDAGSSSASRQTYISGRAVCDASSKLKSFLEKESFYKGRSLKDIYISANAQGAVIFDGYFDPPTTAVDTDCQGIPYATYAFATQMTEIVVDRGTGSCRVVKVHAAHDVGKAINARSVKGQIYGGIAMGMGLALMEEFVPSVSISLDNYYMPTSMDMPEVEIFLVEDEEPTGPYGAKGVGEPALIPQAASIVTAMRDAVAVRVDRLPCTMERLKILMMENKKSEGGNT
jgi:nicotinate dehydrogenase large molybdopterin subunit